MGDAVAKHEALKEAPARAKEDTTLPELLLSAKREEAKKRAGALAVAHRKLEEHATRLAEVQAEGVRVREDVERCAEATKAADAALEEAQRRLTETIAAPSVQAKAGVVEEPRVPPSLPSAGQAALDALTHHVQHMASL